jgi:hypothetical protein
MPPYAPAYFYETYDTHVIIDDLSKGLSDPSGGGITVSTEPIFGPKHGELIIYPNGIFKYDPKGRLIADADSFSYRICNWLNECSVGMVYISVDYEPQIAIDLNSAYCSGVNPMPVSYTSENSTPDKYSIRFSDHEIASGFSEMIRDDIRSRGELSLYLPDSLIPNTYQPLFMFEESIVRVQVLPAELNVLYPATILNQKWNNVIAILNYRYNGRFVFSKYQWMKDDIAIPGERDPIFHVDPNAPVDTVSEFSVLLTRVNDGVTVSTCPIQFVVRDFSNSPEFPYEPMFTVYPTHLSPYQEFTVSVDGDANRIRVIDVRGNVWIECKVLEGKILLQAPKHSGVYIVEVIDDVGERHVRRIIVK